MSANVADSQSLLIELDAILDTRIATVAKISPAASIKLLSDLYRKRNHDDLGILFEDIDNDAFKEAYSKRDTDVLRQARPTKMFFHLVSLTAEMVREAIAHPFVKEVRIDINTYPYKLSEVERKDIETMISYYVGPVVTVSTVMLPPSVLTPKYLDENYTLVVMYDFDTWLVTHLNDEKDIKHKRCPRVTLLAPAKYRDGYNLPKEEDLISNEDGGLRADPFEVTRFALIDYIGLEFYPMDFYSLVQLLPSNRTV